MKFIVVLTACCSIFLYAGAQKTVIKDPNAEVRQVKNFHGIEVSSAIDLFITQSDNEAVAVSAKENKYISRIHTEVNADGILVISFDKSGPPIWQLGNKRLTAYVSVRVLDHLMASGASNIYVDGTLTGELLDLHLSGASDFKGAVQYKTLHIDQSGASDVAIKGKVGELTVEASGASDVKGYELITDNCKVRASGASDVHIFVNKELTANASGASSIHYKGDGVITELHSSGASSVSKKS